MEEMKEMKELAEIIKSVFDEDVLDKTRRREIVDARIIFSKILRERGYTHQSIAMFLRKDHSSIVNYMSNVHSLLEQVSGLMSKYVVCRDTFLVDKENLIISSKAKDENMSIISLKSQLEKLILEKEKFKSTMEKYERISDILSFIDKKTPAGKEKFVFKNIKLMFNEIANYGEKHK